MKASDIIRNVLDLIDQIDCQQEPQEIVVPASDEEPIQTGVDTNRFKQIFDLLSAEKPQMYDNSPAEVVTGIESVTTDAGGGLNGPKHPADLRVKDPSMYPNYQGNNQ